MLLYTLFMTGIPKHFKDILSFGTFLHWFWTHNILATAISMPCKEKWD